MNASTPIRQTVRRHDSSFSQQDKEALFRQHCNVLETPPPSPLKSALKAPSRRRRHRRRRHVSAPSKSTDTLLQVREELKSPRDPRHASPIHRRSLERINDQRKALQDLRPKRRIRFQPNNRWQESNSSLELSMDDLDLCRASSCDAAVQLETTISRTLDRLERVEDETEVYLHQTQELQRQYEPAIELPHPQQRQAEWDALQIEARQLRNDLSLLRKQSGTRRYGSKSNASKIVSKSNAMVILESLLSEDEDSTIESNITFEKETKVASLELPVSHVY